ncbi:MAG TPA: glycerophosphodiester phosphodiesterase family protein [Flavisolibacter sp.]
MKYLIIAAVVIVIVAVIIVLIYRNRKSVPVPAAGWQLFDAATQTISDTTVHQRMSGVYTITKGNEHFGDLAVLKWTWTRHGQDTVYYLSMFCQKDGTHIICEGRSVNDQLLFKGYWRSMHDENTGTAHFTVSRTNGAAYLLGKGEAVDTPGIAIEGSWTRGDDSARQEVALRYQRPLFAGESFEIIGHRGGGRNTERLPASENSVEMVQMASRLGATGVEIDVQTTKDGVPIIYHDPTINMRLVKGKWIPGHATDTYTWAEIREMKLKNNERIPELREMLDTIINSTPLRFIWLDIKTTGALPLISEIRAEYEQKARAAGRKVEIVLGIANEEGVARFVALPGYQNIPSLCELDPPVVQRMNARIWAPQWTNGLERAQVEEVQAQGRRVFVWTLDDDEDIREFMHQGDYNGIVTNYCSAVAFHFYSRQR